VNPVPVEGPAMIVCNHNSVIDLLMITSAFRGISVVGKRGFLFIPFFGLAMALSGMIFVDRRRRFESGDVFHLMRRRLRQGETILVFPQGSRALPFSRKTVKRGLFKVVLEERVPVIPVAISGTGYILKKGQFLFDLTRRLKVFVHVLPPILPEGDPESLADVTAFRDRVVSLVSDMVERSTDLRRERRKARTPEGANATTGA
jgi:1-acyl-sn-glycerol-3-phosphate acyltransferase